MKKLAVLSPRTNALMTEAQSGSPEEMEFTRLFTDMAYGILEGKMPDLLQSIVTFKVLEASVEENKAAGVFVVDQGGTYIYIPVMLSGGKVKSPELFYVKDLDSFLPLTSEWLREAAKSATPEMGMAAKAPSTLANDMDISALTQPPTSGKTAYASDSSYIDPELLPLLEESPNSVKLAYAQFLKDNRAYLNSAYKYHGDKLLSAVRPRTEKVASENKGYWVLTPASDLSEFKEAFGDKQASAAFSQACEAGVVVKDLRKIAEVPVELDLPETTHITEPKHSGVYKVLHADGKHSVAAIFSKPHSIHGMGSTYLVVFPNGDYSITDKVVALTTQEELPEGPLKKALSGEGPKLQQGSQILVKPGNSPEACMPIELKNVSGDADSGMRAMTSAGGYSVQSTSGVPMKVPHVPKGESTAFIPDVFISLKAGKEIPREQLSSSVKDVESSLAEGVAKEASYIVDVKNCGAGMFSINGGASTELAGALEKMASLGLNLPASVSLLSNVPILETKSAAAIPAHKLTKLSSIFGPSQPAPAPAPAPAAMPQGMDPSMGMGMGMGMPPGMDPSMGMGMGMPQGMGGAPELNPAFMNSAAQLNSQEALDAATVAALLKSPELTEIAANYIPALEKALDNLGRILLSVQMNESAIVEKTGLGQYTKLEANLSQVITGLGSLLIDLNEQMTSTQDAGSAPVAY